MPDRKMAILGAPNYSTGVCVNPIYCSASFRDTDFPVSNLVQEEPSKLCRITTLHPIETHFGEQFGPGFPGKVVRTLAGMALVNCNLSRFGKYRVVGKTVGEFSTTTYNTERMAPISILSSTNITGVVGDVDEAPETPDASFITPTVTASPWDARFSFNTPANTPAVGADRQAFVVWAALVVDSLLYPLVTCELYENGLLVANLGTRVVSETTGQLLIFRWNASSLATASGINVEVRISAISGGGGAYAKLGAVEWLSEYGSYSFDSGWLTSPFDSSSSYWGGSFADEVAPEPAKHLVYLPATPWVDVYTWAFLLSDDQTDSTKTGATYATEIARPGTYIQSGPMPTGPLFMPSQVNFKKGALVSSRDLSTKAATIGGQDVGSRRWPQRVLPVELPQLTEQEGYDLFDRIDWRKGKKLPVLVVKFPDAAAANRRHTTLWATLEDMPGLTIGRALTKQSWSGVFVEKL